MAVGENNISAFDRRIREQVILQFVRPGATTGRRVRFQFPPIVASDSKAGNWQEVDYMHAEPYAIFMGGRPREISLQWFYVVGLGGWRVSDVSSQVKFIRSYFYNRVGNSFVINFGAYDVVGPGRDGVANTWTFRSDSVTVQHSNTLISSESNDIYPLRTDISMILKLYTDGSKDKDADQEKLQSLVSENANVTDGLKSSKDLIDYPGGQWF